MGLGTIKNSSPSRTTPLGVAVVVSYILISYGAHEWNFCAYELFISTQLSTPLVECLPKFKIVFAFVMFNI